MLEACARLGGSACEHPLGNGMLVGAGCSWVQPMAPLPLCQPQTTMWAWAEVPCAELSPSSHPALVLSPAFPTALGGCACSAPITSACVLSPPVLCPSGVPVRPHSTKLCLLGCGKLPDHGGGSSTAMSLCGCGQQGGQRSRYHLPCPMQHWVGTGSPDPALGSLRQTSSMGNLCWARLGSEGRAGRWCRQGVGAGRTGTSFVLRQRREAACCGSCAACARRARLCSVPIPIPVAALSQQQ